MPFEQVEKTIYDNFVTNLSMRKGSLEKVTLPNHPNVQFLKNHQKQIVAKRILGETDGSVEFWINRAFKSGPPPAPNPVPGKLPTLYSLTPYEATIGDPDLTLQVNGTNYTDTSVIVFNGGEENTVFVSPDLVTTIVKPSTASIPGSYPVFVRQGDFETSGLLFTFVAPLAPEEAPASDALSSLNQLKGTSPMTGKSTTVVLPAGTQLQVSKQVTLPNGNIIDANATITLGEEVEVEVGAGPDQGLPEGGRGDVGGDRPDQGLPSGGRPDQTLPEHGAPKKR